MGYTDFATEDLEPLIDIVRYSLSDIPTEFLSDNQIIYDLVKAQAYVEMISGATTQSVYMGQCICAVASCYSYINYTALAERQLGTLPPTASVRIKSLIQLAAGLLQPISKYPLNSDLTLDMENLANSRIAAISITPTIIEDD